MGFKTWSPGDVLTAADVNDYLMKQVVIVCTSGTRPSSPVTGMTIYESDTDTYRRWNGSTWVINAVPILKLKAAAESVISSTTLQDDDDLFIAMSINSTWAIQGFINASCASAASDFKMAFTVPTGSTFRIFAQNTAAVNTFEFTASGGSTGFALDTALQGQVWFSGYVKCGGTAGNLQFQWAQLASTATNLFVNAGSWLRADRTS